MPYWRLSAIYLTYFGVVGAMSPFWSVYLQHLKFSPTQIGFLVAIPMITKIIAPNIWGAIAVSTGKPLPVIRWGAAISAVAFGALLWQKQFYLMAAVVALYSFFWNAILAQFEVVTIHLLGNQSHLYSRIRIWGSVGFIVAVVALGAVFQVLPIRYLVPIVLLLLISIWAVALSLPGVNLQHSSAHQSAFWLSLKTKKTGLFFLLIFLVQGSHGVYYTFYSIYLEGLGYSMMFIGFAWALGVLAEIGLFWFIPKVITRLPLERVLVFATLVTALRWLLMGHTLGSVWVIVCVQLLHAISFGLIHSVCIEYVRRHYVGRSAVQAQAFYSAVGYGAGGAVGAIASGYLWTVSPQVAFGTSALVCLLAGVMAWVGLVRNSTSD